VLARAADHERIALALDAAPRQTRFPKTLRREPHSVAAGDAGLAVMCAAAGASLPGEPWDVAAHGFLAAAVHGAERAPAVPWGLFEGLSGLAFAATLLSRDGTRYQGLMATLDRVVASRAAAFGAHAAGPDAQPGMVAFDVVSGASGVGAYLLTRDRHGALPAILRGLVALAQPTWAQPAGLPGGLPGWWTPPWPADDEYTARTYPHGSLNCGLAHGIPGPLALLALALRAGVEVPGQRDAVRALAAWLLAHRGHDQWGVNWPAAVPAPAPGTPWPDPAWLEPGRAAWCYGSPGVARALWLAGSALDDADLRGLAVEAIGAVLRRPVAERRIDSPTFCHGVAGLLQIVTRCWQDTPLPALAAGAAELTDQLLAAYQPERPFGFASLEPGGNPVDRGGLLDGAAGVALALLAAATDTDPAWDRLFLLA
jgi:hypothetical protein